jgi:hypothetical protein
MPKELPIVDIRPGDRFNVYRSQRTGFFILYQYRRHPGAGYDDETRVAIYPTQREATSVRNRLRNAEERVRAEWESEARAEVWAAHQAQGVVA